MWDKKRKRNAGSKRINKKGDAMIVVVCLMFLFTALSLALLLSVSAVTGSLKKNAALTRCRIAAESFSEMMAKDLTDTTRVTQFQEDVKALLLSDTAFDFCWYTGKEGMAWEFQPQFDNGKAVKDTIRGYDITIKVYYGNETGLDADEWNKRKEESEEALKYGDLFLYTTVTCSKGNDSYHIRQKYKLLVIKEEATKWIFLKS